MSWHLARMAPFDLETTSADPEEARIVEAYVGRVGGGVGPNEPDPILVNPGVEVPAEAAAIHGYTTEYLRQYGEPAKTGVDLIAAMVADAVTAGVPLVGHNISYDLTVLDRDCRRHQLPTVSERVGGLLGPVIDTKILSKHVDPYRKRVSKEQGAHVLKTCAQVFQIRFDDVQAHGAKFDALVSARIAWRMGLIAHLPKNERPKLASRASRDKFDALAVDLPALYLAQKTWAAEQAASYAEYLHKQAWEARTADEQEAKLAEAAAVTGDWPYRPYAAAEAVA